MLWRISSKADVSLTLLSERVRKSLALAALVFSIKLLKGTNCAAFDCAKACTPEAVMASARQKVVACLTAAVMMEPTAPAVVSLGVCADEEWSARRLTKILFNIVAFLLRFAGRFSCRCCKVVIGLCVSFQDE